MKGQGEGPPKRRLRIRELTILASVILCAAVFGMLEPRFIGKDPAMAILLGASTDGVMVIGMTIVIVCGGFDLSIGSTMAASGLLAAVLMKSGTPVPLAVLAGLLVGVVVGCTNGLIVTRLKINPFITTLGTMSIIRGIVLVSTKNAPPTGFPESFLSIAWGSVLGIPIPVIIMALATVGADRLLRRLRYLRQVYYVGSNEGAALLTGINVKAVKTFAFALTGLLAATAGIIVASRANAIDPNEGTGAELRVIAAVILGGASLSGGRGTILGSFLGLLLMQIITTGLVFINVAPEAQLIAVGLVLILAAMIDQSGSEVGKSVLAFLTRTRSKKVERIINVVLAIALVIALIVGFGRAGRQSRTAAGALPGTGGQRYVMIAGATGAPYWIDSKAGLQDKAKELGVQATFTGPTSVDANQQIDAVNRAMAEGVDGMIVVPMHGTALNPIINKAIEKGIPVICADADAPKSKRYCFIGTGNFNAGYQGGEYMSKLLNGRGKIALLLIPGADNLRERLEGYRAALKKYPGIQIVQIGNDQGSYTEAQKVCRTILEAHPDLAAFGSVDAGGGQGAAVAVKEAGKVGKVKVLAMDRDEATLQYIREGVIQASIAQRTYTMAYLGLQMLYDLRNDRIKFVGNWRKIGIDPLPRDIDTGSFLITRENVEDFRHR